MVKNLLAVRETQVESLGQEMFPRKSNYDDGNQRSL